MSDTDKTFLELVNDLGRDVGISGGSIANVTGQTGERNRIVNYIADADMFIQNLWEDWKFLHASISITTTAGTSAYSLSDLDGASDVSDISSTLQKWHEESFVYKPATDNAAPLTKLAYEEWRRNQRLGASPAQDTPSQVVFKPDNDIEFVPIPDDTGPITADYQKRAVRMTAKASTSVIPAQYRRMIMLKGKMLYAEFESLPAIYNAAEQEFAIYLERLESNQLPEGHWKHSSQMPLEDLVVTAE